MKENCKIDEISERDNNINFKAALFEEARKSQCFDKELVCCHEDDKKIPEEFIRKAVIDKTEYEYEIMLCSEVVEEGYSCVPNDQCEGLLGVRGEGEPICEDKSQICCHESKEIKSDITIVDNTMARLNKCLNKDMMPYYDSEECYPLFEQGPCAENEWFVLDSKVKDTVLPIAHCETALDCELFTLENEHEGMKKSFYNSI